MVAATPLAQITPLVAPVTALIDEDPLVIEYMARYRRRRWWSAKFDSGVEFRKQWSEYIHARMEIGLHPMINPPPMTEADELAADHEYELWLEEIAERDPYERW